MHVHDLEHFLVLLLHLELVLHLLHIVRDQARPVLRVFVGRISTAARVLLFPPHPLENEERVLAASPLVGKHCREARGRGGDCQAVERDVLARVRARVRVCVQ